MLMLVPHRGYHSHSPPCARHAQGNKQAYKRVILARLPCAENDGLVCVLDTTDGEHSGLVVYLAMTAVISPRLPVVGQSHRNVVATNPDVFSWVHSSRANMNSALMVACRGQPFALCEREHETRAASLLHAAMVGKSVGTMSESEAMKYAGITFTPLNSNDSPVTYGSPTAVAPDFILHEMKLYDGLTWTDKAIKVQGELGRISNHTRVVCNGTWVASVEPDKARFLLNKLRARVRAESAYLASRPDISDADVMRAACVSVSLAPPRPDVADRYKPPLPPVLNVWSDHGRILRPLIRLGSDGLLPKCQELWRCKEVGSAGIRRLLELGVIEYMDANEVTHAVVGTPEEVLRVHHRSDFLRGRSEYGTRHTGLQRTLKPGEAELMARCFQKWFRTASSSMAPYGGGGDDSEEDDTFEDTKKGLVAESCLYKRRPAMARYTHCVFHPMSKFGLNLADAAYTTHNAAVRSLFQV